MKDFRRRVAAKGHPVKVMFPLVSKSDPFYHVYVTAEGRVDWIWEFLVDNGKVPDHANWVYDQTHHNIPQLAQSLANDPKRWYRIVGE